MKTSEMVEIDAEKARDRESDEVQESAEMRSTWTTEELLGDRKEILILHNTETYRLRITRNGKLLLQK